jgi:hypothetical protein
MYIKNKLYEIVERSSGYWIVDDFGVLNGPYDTVEDAQMDVPPSGDLQFPLQPEGHKKKKD